MKVYEFGEEHAKSFVMFQCAVEPWWVFKASAEEMAKDYHTDPSAPYDGYIEDDDTEANARNILIRKVNTQ